MRASRLQTALDNLSVAVAAAQEALAETRAGSDPLASHIFISRRHYRQVNDTKSGKRRESAALSSYHSAVELGFRGSLHEWERLMGAAASR